MPSKTIDTPVENPLLRLYRLREDPKNTGQRITAAASDVIVIGRGDVAAHVNEISCARTKEAFRDPFSGTDTRSVVRNGKVLVE